jgi:hypothetical protein
MASTINPLKQMTVSKFTGVNYKDWAYYMQAALEAIDLWVICGAAAPQCVDRPVPANAAAPTDTEQAEIHQWDVTDSRIIGYLKSYVMQVIMEQAIMHITAAGTTLTSRAVWMHLKTIYDVVSAASVFSTFRKTRDWHLDITKPPLPQLDTLENHYQELTTNTVVIPDFIHAMTLLSAVPPS